MDRLIESYRDEILALAAKHGARHVRLFGSRARGEAGPDSDVDLLVELAEDRDLFDLGALLMELQDLLNCRVETVTEEALHPQLRERILREAVPL